MLKLLLVSALVLINSPMLALSTDRSQPVTIKSATADYNYQTGIDAFAGEVKATQGTTSVLADAITLHRNKNQKVEKIIARGNPARYTTQLEGRSDLFEAHAKTIEYYPQTGKVILLVDGYSKQGETVLTGPRIVYDMNANTVNASSDGTTRTHFTFQP